MVRGIYPFIKRRLAYRSLSRSRRIFKFRFNRRRAQVRRMMRRRIKPELKFQLTRIANLGVPAATHTELTCSPIGIAQGPGIGERIGNAVKFMRNTGNISLTMVNMGAPPPGRASQYIRLVWWTPRIAYQAASIQMSAMDFEEPVDFKIATVHKQMYVQLGVVGTVNIGGTSFPVQPSLSQERVIHWSFKFPRTVNFSYTSNDVDANTDVMYCTLINQGLNDLNVTLEARTTYVDN